MGRRKPITGCMTSGCHDLETLPRKEDSKKVDKALAYRYYKNAYHGQCIGCHKSMKLEIEKSAKTLASMDNPAPKQVPRGVSNVIRKNKATPFLDYLRTKNPVKRQGFVP
jgi:hypothetical protein